MNMMNYHHDKRHSRTQSIPTTIAVIMAFLLLVLLVFPRIQGGITRLDAQVWNVQASWQQVVRSITTSKKSLLQDIHVLEERVNTLEIERLQFDALSDDQQRSITHTESNRVIALVTTRPPETLYDSFIIDKGEQDGIQVGDSVYVYDRIYFGKVASVSATTAHVLAFSSPGQDIHAYHGVSQATLELQGRGNGSFLAEVPQEIDIVEGDALIAQDAARHIIGVVEHIIIDERDPFKHVYVRIPANINGLRYMQIEKK